MPFQPTVPTWTALNAFNSASPSSFVDLRTGQPIYAGGLNLGDYFDLTESEANQLSDSAVGTLHAGRYRLVQVDAGATAANIKTGTVGFMSTVAGGVNLVTSADKALALGLRKVVFLGAITPGNYGFVQELGDASVLGDAAIGAGAALGNFVEATATGTVNAPSATTSPVAATIGKASQLPVASTIFRVLLELPVYQD